MKKALSKLRGIIGVTSHYLTYYRLRTVLAILGVVLAVVLVTLLAGMGYGVTQAGTEALSWINRDLWISAGGLQFAPGAVGGVQNTMLDAHTVAADIESRPDVENAEALGFQAVYVSTNRSSFTTLVGVGGTGNSSQINVRTGDGFSGGDSHYANGSYDGPMSHEVIIDERTAALLNVSVGDTLYIGGTIASARNNAFTVVGVSPTFSTFLGTATVTLRLSELQELTGSTGNDAASLITVTTAAGADPGDVKAGLEETYPEYSVRTNREQLSSILGNQAMVIASAITLVILAIVVGATLVVNTLALLVYHQRYELAALKASGVSTRTLLELVTGQGVAIGVLGGGVGLALIPLVTTPLNSLIMDLTGFPELIKTPQSILAAAFALAVLMGIFGAMVAGWRVARLTPLDHLQ